MIKKFDLKTTIYLSSILLILIAEIFISSDYLQFYTYYIKPIVWGIVAFIGILTINKKRTILNKQDKILYVLTFSIIFTTLYYLMGLIFGYANTPFSRDFSGIIRNIYSFVFIVVLYEIIRQNLISSTNSKFELSIVYITMFLFYIGLSNIIDKIINGISFAYLLGTILPCLIEQLFLTYICKKCGIGCALIWKLPNTLLLYIIPIVPNLNWFFSLFYTSLSCLVSYVFLYYTFINKQLIKNVRVKKTKKPYKSFILIFILLIMIGFVMGLYPLKPVVIVSNSMYPYFSKGDIVVINKNKEYDEGSVIQFEMNGISVVHRIYEKCSTPQGETYYITKGDNNNAEDDWFVYEDQIDGALSCIIPKIGYITIFINQLIGRG